MKHGLLFLLALAALTTAVPTQPLELGGLTIWLGQGQGLSGLARLAARFTAETGTQVAILRPEDPEGRFRQLAAASAGPDILVTSHELLADPRTRELLTAIDPQPSFRSTVTDIGWQAVTVDGRTYGYPLAMECISLIYNKDILDEPPKTFEEIQALDKALQRQRKRALIWDYRTPQFTLPLLAANGGYPFRRRPDGGYELRETGIDSPGARIGAQYLRGLIDQGMLPAELDYATARERLVRGEVAMVLDGPWAWDDLDRRGIRYGVAALPTLNGHPARSYVPVTAGFINAASPNRELATRFLQDYLLTPEGLRTANGDRQPAAVALKALQEELNHDPRRAATFEAIRNSEPFPTTPAMAGYWTALDEAIARIASGSMTVDQALEAAAARLRQGASATGSPQT